MIISDEKSAIFRVSESAKGIELFRLPNNKAEVTFVNTNARSCRLQNTPYRSEASASGHDVLRGQSMLYSTENLGCFTSLALSLAEVPFVERFCILGAIEML